jgi:hypothetical protein
VALQKEEKDVLKKRKEELSNSVTDSFKHWDSWKGTS